jgi:hypothetical protein
MAKIKAPSEGALRYQKKKPTKGKKTRPDGYRAKKPRK